MSQRIWHGAIVLTLAGFVIKILSAVYRLPYQNLAGDVGLYVYQQVYPFYAFAIIMAGTGFPMVLSKIFAEQELQYKGKTQGSVIYTSLITLSGLSGFFFLCLFFGAESLTRLMHDKELLTPLRIIAFAFLFIPFLATMRGFFQGAEYNMRPTALSQVIEQTLRVGIIIGVSVWLFHLHASPYTFGKAAALGSTLGPLGSSLLLLSFFYKRSTKIKSSSADLHFNKEMGKRLIYEGLAFSICSLALVSLQFIDALSLVPAMNLAGMALDKAKEAKGIFDRSYPLIQMGMTAAVAIGTAMVPVLTQSFRSKLFDDLRDQMTFVLRISIIFGAAAGGGLIMIMREANMMLYTNSEGTSTLSWMAVCIVFMSVALTTSTILQSLGFLWVPVFHIGLSLGIKIVLNLFLIPIYGISGAAIASVCATGVLAWTNFLSLKRRYKFKVLKQEQWIQLLFSLIVMIGVVFLWKKGVYMLILHGAPQSRGIAAIVALSSVMIGAMIFLLSLFGQNLLTQEEMEQMPYGDKLYGFYRKMVGKESQT